MSSPLLTVPRGTFTLISRQLQQSRHASTALPFPEGLFKPPASIIKPWRAIAGAQEWQTSTYHYNKQTQKTLPTAAATADRLLTDYATMIKSRGLASTGASGTARSAIAARRKTFEKVYVSGTHAKDFGDKVVVNAYYFDAIEAEREERQREMQKLKERSAEKRRQGGAGGGRRRPPMRTGLGGPGGRTGPARPPMRFGPGAGAGNAVRRPVGGSSFARPAGMRFPGAPGGGAAGAGGRPSRDGGVQRATGAGR